MFGTPCQIYGFSQTSKYKRKPDNYLLVDIFCHGCPSMKLWKSYLKYMSKRTGCSEYDKVVFRSKTHAWHEYCFDFISKSKQYSSKKSKDPFYDIFFGMDIMNEACYDCNSRSSMAYGDIRLGDYWGEKYDTNTKGVSAVVVKTPKGMEIFEAVKNRLNVEEVTLNHILAAQSYGKTHFYNRQRRRFLLQNMSGDSDLKEVYTTYMKMFPLKSRIKKQLKAIVKCCPKSVYFPIKKLIHSI
ncbi:Coenzyme F420 hydrogenase/dehydrogenase, beta subunit C-terminal domain [Bacteroides thetaiotaomicron]|uniref:Coenzyme F420 hydrogenase/dehydrogenase, beta subunit C-terminal domain n=1 Tax=Bacteroides thetaiotaomicron TaxID=818 RepID=UPI0028686F64|nr:Coenzyme F420 hydrogenase/dehydrogenase, beta subunit C-terminal domain [Bacteroides thetaiotaomicron]